MWRRDRTAGPDGPERASPRSHLTMQAAFVLGFAGILGLWLATGYRLAREMETLESRTSAITERYTRAQSQLSAVRAHLMLGSVLVRDALIDPDVARTRAYRKRFEDTYQAADLALREYVPVLDDADERARLVSLRSEVDEFRRAMLEVLDIADRAPLTAIGGLLRERVMPQREVAVRVSEQVQAMNREAFVRQGLETSALYRETQRAAWTQLGFAVVLSVAIGLLAAVHWGRLERRVRRQRLRDQQLTTELQRLSSRIVTAQEDERRAIARELHDEVGQALAAVKVELALTRSAVDTPPELGSRLQRVQAITEGALQQLRSLSHLLHPAALDDLGLEAALETHLRSVEHRHGLVVQLEHDQSDQRLAPELETAVYRIVQEAVTNVVTHAHASRCQVRVQGLPQTVAVTVDDNGSGFDADAMRSQAGGGLGLIGIRERVAQFGGSFRIESAPGRGTRVSVELPARVRAGADEAPGPGPEAARDEALPRGTAAHLPG